MGAASGCCWRCLLLTCDRWWWSGYRLASQIDNERESPRVNQQTTNRATVCVCCVCGVCAGQRPDSSMRATEELAAGDAARRAGRRGTARANWLVVVVVVVEGRDLNRCWVSLLL